jgi:hypothetical protein
MNILFDLTATQPQSEVKFHGGGLYGEVVFFALLKRTKNFIGIYDSKLYINPKILKSEIKLYDINKFSFKEIIKKENIDIFYSSGFNHTNEWRSSVKKYITTWHDVRNLEFLYGDTELHYARSLKENLKKILMPFMKN